MSAATIACTVVLAAACASAFADDARLVPTVDPFQQPQPQMLARPADAIVASEVAQEPEKMPTLRAVLQSSKATFVNLDGQLIAVGDKFQDYRIVAAGMRDAVLLRDHHSYVLSMDDDKGEKHAQRRRTR